MRAHVEAEPPDCRSFDRVETCGRFPADDATATLQSATRAHVHLPATLCLGPRPHPV